MSSNIKFKRTVKFALHVLQETITDQGTNNKTNSAYLSNLAGYKQVIEVLKAHSGEQEFVQNVCGILNQMFLLNDDRQLYDKMVESGAASALNMAITSETGKDVETKQKVLKLFEYLFQSSGVLRKEVIKQSAEVFDDFFKTDSPQLAVDSIACLTGAIISSGEVDVSSIRKVLQLIKKHQSFKTMPKIGSEFIKQAFSVAQRDELDKEDFKMEQIISSFGIHNVNDIVSAHLRVAAHRIGSEDEFDLKLQEAIEGQCSSKEAFLVLMHLISVQQIELESREIQLTELVSLLNQQGKIANVYAESSMFLDEFYQRDRNMCLKLMGDKQQSILDYMQEIDARTGQDYRFKGLLVLMNHVSQHGDFMKQNELTTKLKTWISECKDPKDMALICEFMAVSSKSNELLRVAFNEEDMDEAVLDKVNADFSQEGRVFEEMTIFFDSCFTNNDELRQFCEDAQICRYITLGYNNFENITNFDEMLTFIGRFYSLQPTHPKLADSYKEIIQLFSTRFEMRVSDWAEEWYNQREDKSNWELSYQINFLEDISNSNERITLKRVMADKTIEQIEQELADIVNGEKGAEANSVLSLKLCELNCLVMIQEPSSLSDITSRNGTIQAVKALISNIDHLRNKQALETRIISRFVPLWCSMLPIFKNQLFLESLSAKDSEFLTKAFIDFISNGIKKDSKACMLVILAYSHTFLNEQYVTEEYVESLEAKCDKISALTVVLGGPDDEISPLFAIQMENFNRKPPQEICQYFYGHLTLMKIFQNNLEDMEYLLECKYLNSIASKISSGVMNQDRGIEAIFMLDGWCSVNSLAIEKLNTMDFFENLLKYMNDNRNNQILRQVAESLLSKGVRLKDVESLKFELKELIKKCREYESSCDQEEIMPSREEILEVYNKIYGMIQVEDAASYCIEEKLQSVVISTLAKELSQDSEQLIKEGKIVEFQNTANQMIVTANFLYDSAQSTQESRKIATSALERACQNWSEDLNLMKGMINVFSKMHPSSSQIEISEPYKTTVRDVLTSIKDKHSEDLELVKQIERILAAIGIIVSEDENADEQQGDESASEGDQIEASNYQGDFDQVEKEEEILEAEIPTWKFMNGIWNLRVSKSNEDIVWAPMEEVVIQEIQTEAQETESGSYVTFKGDDDQLHKYKIQNSDLTDKIEEGESLAKRVYLVMDLMEGAEPSFDIEQEYQLIPKRAKLQEEENGDQIEYFIMIQGHDGNPHRQIITSEDIINEYLEEKKEILDSPAEGLPQNEEPMITKQEMVKRQETVLEQVEVRDDVELDYSAENIEQPYLLQYPASSPGEDIDLDSEAGKQKALGSVALMVKQPFESQQDGTLSLIHSKFAGIEISSLEMAIFYARFYAYLAQVTGFRSDIRAGDVPANLLKNIATYPKEDQLLKYTSFAFATFTLQDPDFVKVLKNLQAANALNEQILGLMDPIGVIYFGRFAARYAADFNQQKELLKIDYTQTLNIHIETNCSSQDYASASCIDGLSAIASSNVTCAQYLENENFIRKLMMLGIDKITQKQMTISFLHFFRVMNKYGGDSTQALIKTKQLREFYAK